MQKDKGKDKKTAKKTGMYRGPKFPKRRPLELEYHEASGEITSFEKYEGRGTLLVPSEDPSLPAMTVPFTALDLRLSYVGEGDLLGRRVSFVILTGEDGAPVRAVSIMDQEQ